MGWMGVRREVEGTRRGRGGGNIIRMYYVRKKIYFL